MSKTNTTLAEYIYSPKCSQCIIRPSCHIVTITLPSSTIKCGVRSSKVNVKTVKELLKNSTPAERLAAFHAAVSRKLPNIVKLILDYGIDTSTTFSIPPMALTKRELLAALIESRKIPKRVLRKFSNKQKKFIAATASPDTIEKLLKEKLITLDTIFVYTLRFSKYAKTLLNQVYEIAKKNGTLSKIKDVLLASATYIPDLKLMETLLLEGANPNNTRDLPLRVALRRRSEEAVKLLLKFGAKPSIEKRTRIGFVFIPERLEKILEENAS